MRVMTTCAREDSRGDDEHEAARASGKGRPEQVSRNHNVERKSGLLPPAPAPKKEAFNLNGKLGKVVIDLKSRFERRSRRRLLRPGSTQRETYSAMKRISRIETTLDGVVAAAAAVFLLGAFPTFAADPSDPSSQNEPGWHFYSPVYVWAAGVKGTTATLPGVPASDVDMSFSDSLSSLKDLDGALVATVFARKDRLILVADLNWARLSPTQSVPFDGDTVDLKFFSETFTLMGTVGYRLVDDPSYSIDALGGAKLWYMDNSASVKPAVVTPNKVERTETWVDGVVGGQITYNLTDDFFVDVLGFVGAGGSQFYGDIYAGIGYWINPKWQVFAGYRALRVERENDGFLYDVTQQGPLLGVGARF